MHVFEFDIRGQICPSTLLTALREINRHRTQLKEGLIGLRFLTDNRNATVTIPQAVTNMGYRIAVDKIDRHYGILVSRETGGSLTVGQGEADA